MRGIVRTRGIGSLESLRASDDRAGAPITRASVARAPRRLRHRARELRAVVLPPHGARGDRRRARRARSRSTRAILGTLAATYFYVYTLLQIPVGVLADTLGPRRILTAGSLVAGVGSLAVRARADVGGRRARPHARRHRRVGRVHRDPQDLAPCGFPPNRFATLNGVTMFAGNLGRRDRRRAARVGRHAGVVARGVRRLWRVLSLALACGDLVARARPARGRWASRRWTRRPPRRQRIATGRARSRRCSPIPRRGPASSSTSASAAASSPSPACGPCRTSSEVYGMSRVTAAQHASLLLLGVAFGVAGRSASLSDRLAQPARPDARVHAARTRCRGCRGSLHVDVAAAGHACVVLR